MSSVQHAACQTRQGLTSSARKARMGERSSVPPRGGMMPLKRLRYGSQIVLHKVQMSAIWCLARTVQTLLASGHCDSRERSCNSCRGVWEPRDDDAPYQRCVVEVPGRAPSARWLTGSRASTLWSYSHHRYSQKVGCAHGQHLLSDSVARYD